MVNSICGIYCIYNIAYYNRGVAAGEAKSKVGTATADKVLAGYTFSGAAGVGIAGTMVNRGTLNWNPTSNTTQTIQPGYYSGGTLNSAGAYNAGVAKGAADSRVGTATADKVLSGYTFTNSAGAGIAGTMVNRGTLNWNPTSSTTQTIQPGYYSGGTLDSSGAYQAGYNAGLVTANNQVNKDSESYKQGKIDGLGSLKTIYLYTPVWTEHGGIQYVYIRLVKQSNGGWKNESITSGDYYAGTIELKIE